MPNNNSRRLLSLTQATLLLLVIAISVPSSATEIFEYNQTIEGLGMGGVRILRPNDPASMLVNPAALAWNQGFSWDVVDMGLGVNTSAVTGSNSFANFNASNLSNYYGRPLWVGANGHTTLVFPNLGFSIYNQGNIGMVLNNPAFPNMTLNLSNDYGFMVGTAAELLPGVSLGANFKRVTRMGGTFDLGPNELQNVSTTSLQSNLQNEGTGYGFDLGAIAQLPGALKPTFHAGWKDVGSMAFIRSKGTITPTTIRDNLTLGYHMSTEFPGFGFAAGLEYRNVNFSGEQLGKKVHLGVELELGPAVARAGFYQGYTTYGASVSLAFIELNAALYSVETGVYPGQTASQRAEAGMVISIAFNPDLSLLDSSSAAARRKLKQRR